MFKVLVSNVPTSSASYSVNQLAMPSPPSQMLQQLRLSEQQEDLSQRQKSDHHGHKSTVGRRAVLMGAAVKPPTSEPKVGRTVAYDPASYEREFSVMTAVSRIPALVNHAPRIVKADPSSGIIVLNSPKLYWDPFLDCLEAE
ncbi:uncharacterized protein N7515_002102 [Penicillium bovifimosum]|uniref:Uncharacterized protein n=1 Tax=Penicillium bovifimosum TaxID=126998 RepID=A0A9W9HAZ2_9EURO|nr:uncharacterized protein N7515_002102 [Penicillium bovifimosum]KAJ5143315.1 hypothetical protein N7515_002102 [Penicillium bovifimosum]